jgi:hypothetical protein
MERTARGRKTFQLAIRPRRALQFGHLDRVTLGDLCSEGGYRTQPRVSPWETLKITEFALKGREADQNNLAPGVAQKLVCGKSNMLQWSLLSRYSTFKLPPPQDASLWVAIPRVKTLIFIHNLSAGSR